MSKEDARNVRKQYMISFFFLAGAEERSEGDVEACIFRPCSFLFSLCFGGCQVRPLEWFLKAESFTAQKKKKEQENMQGVIKEKK